MLEKAPQGPVEIGGSDTPEAARITHNRYRIASRASDQAKQEFAHGLLARLKFVKVCPHLAGGPTARGDGGGGHDLRGPLLHWQQAGRGPVLRPGAAGALADRELLALAVGRDVPGGRQPHPGPERGRELRPAATGGLEPAEASPEQRQPGDQAVHGDAG